MQNRLAPLLLLAAVVGVFGQVVGFDFLIYDDDPYVTGNPAVLDGFGPEGLRWALTAFHRGTWMPVTWASHMLDVELFGAWAGGHHLGNLLLHALATVLLWAWLRRATGRAGAALALALIFAVHPLQVQSVGWVAERKGLLAACFGLASLHPWLSWVRTGRRWAYGLALLLYALGLASKPVLVPWPLLLLLLDRWPLDRWRAGLRRRLLLEKLPFLGLALGGATLAWRAQAAAGALGAPAGSGVSDRVLGVAVVLGRTLRRFLWPQDLAAFYPRLERTPVVEGLLWLGILLLLALGAWRLRRSRPALGVGLAIFLLLLLPTAGLVPFGAQLMADRFAYLPLIGLGIVLVYGFHWPKASSRVLLSVVLLLLALVSGRQAHRWRGTIPLLEHSLHVAGPAPLVHVNLALAHRRAGNPTLAREHLEAAAALDPADAEIRFQLADLLASWGRPEEALMELRQGLALEPGRASAHAKRGELLLARGEAEAAILAYREARRLAPQDPRLGFNLAQALGAAGRHGEQIEELRSVLEQAPGLPGVRPELAWALATAADPELRDGRAALRLVEAELREIGMRPRALEVKAAALAATGAYGLARAVAEEAERLALEGGLPEQAAAIRARRALYLR